MTTSDESIKYSFVAPLKYKFTSNIQPIQPVPICSKDIRGSSNVVVWVPKFLTLNKSLFILKKFFLTRILSGGVVKRDEQMKFGGNYRRFTE